MRKMYLKHKGITWVGNIYQKFEAVCQEVDELVNQEAVRYIENQVFNVGDSVKKFYSDSIQELLPSLVNSVKHGARTVSSKNDTNSSFMSVAADKEYIKGTELNTVNNIKSSHESIAVGPVNNQQAHVPLELDLINQDSDQTSSNSMEVENCCLPREEVVENESSEPSDALKENLHAGIEQNAAESTLQLLNLMPLKEKELLKTSTLSESPSYYYENGCGADVSAEQNYGLDLEENAMKSSTPQMLNFVCLDKKESFNASFIIESSDGIDEIKCGILAEVSTSTCVANMKCQSSPKAGTVNDNIEAWDQCDYGGSEFSDSLVSSEVANSTVSFEKSMMKMETSCFNSSLNSDSLSSKSPGSYSLEIESCKNYSVDNFVCSMVLVSGTPTHVVANQSMELLGGLVSCGSNQSMESNDGEISETNVSISLKNSSGIRHGQICSVQDRAMVSLSDTDVSLVNSIKSSMEDIQLGDEAILEKSCVFVDDSELYAASCRARGLQSYKKRIQDAFAPKKRLAKEYEQLAIWYGDSDVEPSQGTWQTRLPFNSRTSLELKNLQGQHACETEWELL